jgi:uncharacterized membrane protein YgcG
VFSSEILTSCDFAKYLQEKSFLERSQSFACLQKSLVATFKGLTGEQKRPQQQEQSSSWVRQCAAPLTNMWPLLLGHYSVVFFSLMKTDNHKRQVSGELSKFKNKLTTVYSSIQDINTPEYFSTLLTAWHTVKAVHVKWDNVIHKLVNESTKRCISHSSGGGGEDSGGGGGGDRSGGSSGCVTDKQ